MISCAFKYYLGQNHSGWGGDRGSGYLEELDELVGRQCGLMSAQSDVGHCPLLVVGMADRRMGGKYWRTGTSKTGKEQPGSVSPDLSKSAWVFVQPPPINAGRSDDKNGGKTHQRDEKHVVISTDAAELDAGAKAQGDEHGRQHSHGHAGGAQLGLLALGQICATRYRRQPSYGATSCHPVRRGECACVCDGED